MRLHSIRLVLLVGILALVAVRAGAQPRPADSHAVTVSFSHSTANALAFRGVDTGNLSATATTVAWRGSAELSPATRFLYGIESEYFDFQRPTASPVPASLQEIAVVLGATHRLSQQWLVTGNIRPGVSGDLEGQSGDAFNAPLLLLATWRQRPTLAWAFGVRGDWLADRPVIPFVGVNWKFAPEWEFSLGMPRAGVTYTAHPDLKWTLGVSVQGGNFHVARDPRPAPIAVGPRLDDTTLDYHEIRVGLSADWRLNETFSLTAEAGLITDQKFDYFDRDYVLNGDEAGFLSIGLSGRF